MNRSMQLAGQKTLGDTVYNVFVHEKKHTVTLVRVTHKITSPELQHNNQKRRRVAKGKH